MPPIDHTLQWISWLTYASVETMGKLEKENMTSSKNWGVESAVRKITNQWRAKSAKKIYYLQGWNVFNKILGATSQIKKCVCGRSFPCRTLSSSCPFAYLTASYKYDTLWKFPCKINQRKKNMKVFGGTSLTYISC